MDYCLLHKKLLHNLFESNTAFDLHIPFHGFQHELVRELKLKSVEILLELPRAVLSVAVNERPIWSQDWWPACQLKSCVSDTAINLEKQTIDFLKSQKNFGVYHQIEVNKISDRIHKKIKSLDVKRIKYQENHPFNFKFYAWTMISDYLIFCEKTNQRFPLGWHEFNEDKTTPPNRAYLKLWELFSVYNFAPTNKPEALEIGASPGGWSWVLSHFCSVVHTIDRAPLDQKLNSIQNIRHKIGDAFKLNSKDYDQCSWFYSDIICTPEKMYETVCFWLENSAIQNFVCTIKFKGDCDFEILKKFQQIPDSKIIHLYQNKNEVTWIKTVGIKM